MKSKENQFKVIEEMIANAKGNLSEGSVFYLLWGWLVIIAASSNYILLSYRNFEMHWLPWMILMPLGGVISMIVGYRMNKNKRVKTYVESALNYLWLGFVITLLMVLFGMAKIGPQKAYPIIILLYGLGTFVSGGIIKFKPLMIGGVLCWLLGSIAFYAPFDLQLIILIIATVLSYLLPAYLLKQKSAKQNV